MDLSHIAVGLIKGTVYGILIAFAGCLRGMQCGRSAQAVGQATTSAVVTSIVLIVICGLRADDPVSATRASDMARARHSKRRQRTPISR